MVSQYWYDYFPFKFLHPSPPNHFPRVSLWAEVVIGSTFWISQGKNLPLVLVCLPSPRMVRSFGGRSWGPNPLDFDLGGGNSNIFQFSPRELGKWSNLTNIYQMGWSHQLVVILASLGAGKKMCFSFLWWVEGCFGLDVSRFCVAAGG